MTITAYQVESVVNAYTRQSKLRVSQTSATDTVQEDKYKDVVSLSLKEENKTNEFDKISYNIRDVILKNNEG